MALLNTEQEAHGCLPKIQIDQEASKKIDRMDTIRN